MNKYLVRGIRDRLNDYLKKLDYEINDLVEISYSYSTKIGKEYLDNLATNPDRDFQVKETHNEC